MSPSLDPYVGNTMGRYQLLERTGGGRSGPMYQARKLDGGQLVTVKLLPQEVVRSPSVVKRFQREVEIATALDHPNLLVAYEAGEQDGTHFVAMEYTAGQDLEAIVRRDGPLDIERALDYLRQAATALDHLHTSGVLHRGIKPATLLVDNRGTLKIGNLLTARLDTAVLGEEADDHLTGTGQLVGNVDYLAPEQAVDSRAVTPQSDIYSLGCTLYYLLTGKLPYAGKSMLERLKAHHSAPIPSLADARPEVPEWLDQMFQQMLAKSPKNRPKSMKAIVRRIESPDSLSIPPILIPIMVVILALVTVLILANM